MQLDKVVAYHKALADPTRIKLLILLAKEEASGQSLAEMLGVSPPTVTHHASKLRAAGLIHERRDKNTIWFSLNREMLLAKAGDIPKLIDSLVEKKEEDEPMKKEQEQVEQSVIRNFITADGKLKHIPAQLKKKLIVLKHIILDLEPGKDYTEKEINEWIRRYHEDFATLRREFVMQGFVYRDRDIYRLNPVELWKKWEQLG